MAAGYENIHFVAFASPPPSENAATIWPKAFGGTPFLNFSTIGGAHTSASATLSGMQIELQVQPGRIDIVLAAQNLPGTPSAAPPVLADVKAALTTIRPAFDEICRQFQPGRLAFVAQTQERASDESDAARKFAAATQLTSRDEAVDLAFQVNVRKPFAAQKNLTMNRLCRWATNQVMLLQIPLQGLPGQFISPSPSNAVHVLNTFVDINTAPTTPLHQARVPKIVDELVSEAQSIVASGYVHL